MQKFITSRLLTLCLFLVLGGVANAQELKVGFVDMARVLKDAPQAELARKKLETEFAPRDDKIVSMQKRLKNLDERQNREIANIDGSERRKIERDMIELRRDIKRAKEEFTEDFNLRRNEELTKLQKLISRTTIAVAKDEGYDIVLSDSVLFTSKRVNITDKILDRLRSAKDLPQAKTTNTSN